MAPAGLSSRDRALLDTVVDLVVRRLGADVLGICLYGSAVLGGLRPDSDLDVLVVTARPTTPDDRRKLIDGLLPISGRRAVSGPARSVELTVVVQADVRPWRYPPPLDFQYGDWWRYDYGRGELQPWESPNADLAVLLATVLRGAVPLLGRPPDELLEPVPDADLRRATLDCIPGLLLDLESDTRNVVLTLARVWQTVATGRIGSKDAAADWALARLPAEHQAVLARARAGYLGEEAERWDDLRPRLGPFVEAVLAGIDQARAGS